MSPAGEDRGVDLDALRLAVYRSFAERGHPPSFDDLAPDVDTEPSMVAAGLRELAATRHLVLDRVGRIVMAHPFSALPMGFSVMGGHTLWWGGCAWDSFALPQLLSDEPGLLVATRCPNCDRALSWVVRRDEPPQGDEVAHFLVPVAHMWDDVVHTCSNQRLFCSTDCVDSWLARTGNARGYVMDLTTLRR